MVLMVRLKPGLVGERLRVCHLVSMSPGRAPERLVAYCGASFRPKDVDWVDLGRSTGAPCNRCLSLARSAVTDLLTAIIGEEPDAADTGDGPGDAVGNLTRFLRDLAVQLPGFADKVDAGVVAGNRLHNFADILHDAVTVCRDVAGGAPRESGVVSDLTVDTEPVMTPAVGHLDGEWPR
jgi:hypothetical protein